MEQFLSTLIIIILVIYALGFLFRLISPWLIKKFFSHMMDKANQQFSGSSSGNQKKQQDNNDDGPTTQKTSDGLFLKPHRKQGQSLSDLLGGEYINFEEI